MGLLPRKEQEGFPIVFSSQSGGKKTATEAQKKTFSEGTLEPEVGD